MGQLIDLATARADHSRPSRSSAAFFFAPGCPISYLAAERIERILGELDWVPIVRPATSSSVSPHSSAQSTLDAGARLKRAEQEAELLRLPLVEPDAYPLTDTRPIGRAVLFAAEHGADRKLALASLRLAFCGGFNLAEPDAIALAAEAANLRAADVLAATRDSRYDLQLDATANGLSAQGVSDPPAIRLGDRWFDGLGALDGATGFASVRALYGPSPLRTTG